MPTYFVAKWMLEDAPVQDDAVVEYIGVSVPSYCANVVGRVNFATFLQENAADFVAASVLFSSELKDLYGHLHDLPVPDNYVNIRTREFHIIPLSVSRHELFGVSGDAEMTPASIQSFLQHVCGRYKLSKIGSVYLIPTQEDPTNGLGQFSRNPAAPARGSQGDYTPGGRYSA